MGRVRWLPQRHPADQDAGPSWRYDDEAVDARLLRPFTEHGVHPDYAIVCLELGVSVPEMLAATASGLPGEYLALRRAAQRAGVDDEHAVSLARVRHAPHILAGLIDGVPLRDLLAITDPAVGEGAADDYVRLRATGATHAEAADDYVRLRATGATHAEAREVIAPQLVAGGSGTRTSLFPYLQARAEGLDHEAALAAHRSGYPKLST
jgi:hypothetical protein